MAVGKRSADLSITKAGNRRLSDLFNRVRLAPGVAPARLLAGPEMEGGAAQSQGARRRRKQAIVAFARQLLVDLWKWKTGRVSAERLGWVMS